MIIISNRRLVKFLTFNFARAITIFPFILLNNKSLKRNKELINHEKIHIRQQLEMLIIPFYIWYLTEFFIRFVKTRSRDLAYISISFEREAYTNEGNVDYTKNRKFWAFLRYL
jgi:hypothetical protein